MLPPFEDEYDDREERAERALEQRMRERFTEDPAGWLTFLINGIKAAERPAAVEALQETILFYSDGSDFKPTKLARKVLQTLANARTTMIGVDLEDATHISRKTVGDILKRLLELGLVERREGKRKGVTITAKGRRYIPTD